MANSFPAAAKVANFKPNLAEERAIHASNTRGVNVSPKGVLTPKAPSLNVAAPKPSGAPLGGMGRKRRYYGEDLASGAYKKFNMMKGLG